MLDFLKERHGAMHIATARKQQKQINYLIQSSIQEDITQDYIRQWVSRKYATNDFFLNWVKTVFKTTNFLSFYKYLRYPLPTARLVNDDIKPQLKRVFYADDAYSKYSVRGKDVLNPEYLDSETFNEIIFDALLFRFNDVVVCDLMDINKPIRNIISIEDIVAIKSCYGVIEKIAYSAIWNDTIGYLCINDVAYSFYSKDHILLNTVPHDLGYCPADYVSNEAFYSDNDIVRKSIFSYVRPDMEEYVFLKTLQKMSEPNGSIPIITKLKTKENPKDGKAQDGLSNEPMAANTLTANPLKSTVDIEMDGTMQTGSVYSFPAPKKNDGGIDMDSVKNFINFFYIPVECLDFINTRVKEIRSDLLGTVLGDYVEQNQSAKNELQVGKSYDNKQDKLRHVSKALSTLRTRSDRTMLGLQFGIKSITADYFFGSDFFLETQADLFDLIKNAPNVFERKNLLSRLSQNKNRFNPDKAAREKLMYDLMPYAADVDFATALEQQLVSIENKILQTQFNYYISLFEAEYGDILAFYINLEASNSEKLILINNLLMDLIKNNLPQSVEVKE